MRRFIVKKPQVGHSPIKRVIQNTPIVVETVNKTEEVVETVVKKKIEVTKEIPQTIEENKVDEKQEVMDTKTKIELANAVLGDANESKVKKIKKDKGLIERTESSKSIITEDNRELLRG